MGRCRYLPQPARIDAETGPRFLFWINSASARGRADRELWHADQIGRVPSRRRPTKQRFVNSQIGRETPAILFRQPARAAAMDKLLNISGVSAEQPRQGRIILPALANHLIKGCADIIHAAS